MEKGNNLLTKLIVFLVAAICISGIILIYSSNQIFENQYVKFEAPNGLNVTDQSTNTCITVYFYKGSEKVGSIECSNMNKDVYNESSQSDKVIIAGKVAKEISDNNGIYGFIKMKDINNSFKGIKISFKDAKYLFEYNTVKNSLIIKKTP